MGGQVNLTDEDLKVIVSLSEGFHNVLGKQSGRADLRGAGQTGDFLFTPT